MITDWLPPELPQLASLLDPLEMETILARGPFAESGIANLRLERIRYRPGRNCLVSWSGSVESSRGPHRIRLSILAGRDVDRDRRPTPSGPVSRDGATPLPELDAVLWVFPQDRKLRGITALTGHSPLLTDLAVELDGIDPDETLEVVQFVAERACTVRLKLRDSHGCVYGKFYRPGESTMPWELMNQLWMSQPCQNGELLIPKPLVRHPATESVWIQGLEGRQLDQQITAGQLYETGWALARLHATPLAGLALVSETELAAQRGRAIETILLVRPDLRQRLVALSQSLGSVGTGPPVTLHGDLHPKNLFGLGEGRIGLIDLDNLVRGDRWLDLASLAASLCDHGLQMESDSGQIDHQLAELRRGYESATGEVIAERCWRKTLAHTLLAERGYRSVTRLKPDLSDHLERLVVLAERLVLS